MKNSNTLKVIISRPIEEVFEFVTNPKNTAKWVDSIVAEETNEFPVKQGTIYKNQNKQGDWSEYVMSDFIVDKQFTLSNKDNGYHVKYTLTSLSPNETELEYSEWVDEQGDLGKPFTQDVLDKLKNVIEAA